MDRVRTAFPAGSQNLAERHQLLRDQLAIYNAHGASWSIWAYKDVGDEGLITVRPESPWLKLMAPVIEKKARLGVDGWGSLDRGVRSIIDPIERLFDQEYPGFDLYPFGRADWIATLVRSIVLAEPMLGDVARLVGSVDSDDEVVALANSFRFDQCNIRTSLQEVIAEAAAAPEA